MGEGEGVSVGGVVGVSVGVGEPQQDRHQRLWGMGRKKLGCPLLRSSSAIVAERPPVSWSCSHNLTRLLEDQKQKVRIARLI